MSTHYNFARRLASERKRLGLTQVQFAEACGIKVVSQFMYEKGDRVPKLDYLLRAREVGVSLSYLFDDTPSVIGAQGLTLLELAQIFKEADDASRDSLGRLLDLELRVKKFTDLVMDRSELELKVGTK